MARPAAINHMEHSNNASGNESDTHLKLIDAARQPVRYQRPANAKARRPDVAEDPEDLWDNVPV